MKMVAVEINGTCFEVDEKKTILEVADENNIEIPTLCYHKYLSPYGACRLCVVEILKEGWSKLATSCTLPVEEGLRVLTDSEKVVKSRKMTIELLLSRCPGEEALLKLAEEYGVKEPRFKKKDDNCILCGLCIRMCERMGVNAISFINRGYDRKVKPPFEEHSEVCQTCGACAFICPTNAINLEEFTKNKPIPILDEFDRGLRKRSVMHISYPQAVPNWPVIDSEHCIHLQTDQCGICKDSCDADAIDFEQKEQELEIDVGSVILSPGFDEYTLPKGDSYGYKVYPNVLTSIEFERILSASGPYQGHIKRISDGKSPKKIAWLQCVGSRDESCDRKYCSSVCCMYATKEAVIAKEHQPDVESHIYFMDMRSFGKDFDKYFARAQDEYGVVYRRCRIPRVEQDRETKNLIIRYVDEDGDLKKETYDMVVLSVGLQPCKALGDLSKVLDVNLNEYGFVETDPFSPVTTSHKGIYASGTVTEPKDIPESVTQASAAAADAAKDIFEVRGTEITEKVYPEEKLVINEFPRIGVFVCHCGINIAGVVDVKKVVEYAKTLPYVVHADDSIFTCSQDSQEKIKEKIQEFDLNRVVIASCTPRTHEPLFQDTLREAGLNPHLFEMANIRDQNSWVHKNEPQSATEKAIDVVRMAVSKSADLYPVHHLKIPVVHNALVIGGGISGMQSALSIADQGYEVFLVEREPVLGGHLRDIYLGVNGEQPQELLEETIEKVNGHSRIQVFTGTTVDDVSGYVGNFKTKLMSKDKKVPAEIEHGIIVVASGGLPYEPVEYQYAKSDEIVTQTEFEKDLFDGKTYLKKLQEIVMIQCVGSRNDEHPYCSRVCCSQALKNALRFKEINPDAAVYILYRDIRTYGFREDVLYQKARKKGILFVRYDEDEEPEVKIDKGEITVKTFERVLRRQLHLHPDKLVLSTGIIPADNITLSKQLKIPLNADNFYAEAHVKLRPIDFSADGIFLCGLAHSPRFIEESVLQAKATAARAATILSKEYLETKGNVAHVRSRNCAGCKLCLEICPYDAITFDEEKKIVEVNEILCQGCGACSAICPSGVSQQNTFTKRQILSMVDACLE